jgi:hypothetical protein
MIRRRSRWALLAARLTVGGLRRIAQLAVSELLAI